MGKAFYCAKCGTGYNWPTAREDIEGYICPNTKCQALLRRHRSDEEWIIDIDERLRELENK